MTAELGQDDKRMNLRYAGNCRLCGAQLPAGTAAIYERATKTVRCVDCEAAVADASGVAGASARREYERRKNKREQRIRANHPKLGGLILSLSDDPQSARAWERGAVGEELLAQRLAGLPDTFRVLHDRRIPGTRANIDHIVIGPTGVWVIDAKRYAGKRPALQVEGGIVRPRVETLRIGGWHGTKLLHGVQAQVARVRECLHDEAAPTEGVLCFLDADWPLIGGSFSVDGIHVVWPRLIIKKLAGGEPREIDVQALSDRLARALPRA